MSMLGTEFWPSDDSSAPSFSQVAETMTLDIEWSWPFEDDADASNGYVDNAKDTVLGYRLADTNPNNDPIIKIEMTQTIEQIIEDDGEIKRYGDTVKFGSYPQSEVKDTTLVTKLNNLEGVSTLPTEGKETVGKWQSYNYYYGGSVQDFMWYADVDLDEDGKMDYRGVYFVKYRPNKTTLASSAANSDQDTHGYKTKNVYWFKYEPIKWTVLEEDGKTGIVYVISELPLDSQQFYHSTSAHTVDGKEVYANNYAHSDIRAWLNDTFYNTAFNATQQEMIQYTEVDNSAATTYYPTADDTACENTLDKIFLPSYADVKNNGNFGFKSASDRQRAATPYARSQGAYVNGGTQSIWLLRSPATGGENMTYVNSSSNISTSTPVVWTRLSTNPLMRIQLYEPAHICEDRLTVAQANARSGSQEEQPDHLCDICGVQVTGHTYSDNECTVCAENTANHYLYKIDGDTIEFGYYPQTDVTNEDIAAALNVRVGADDPTKLPSNENNNGWGSYKYYKNGTNTEDYMWYIDVQVGLDKYRGVYYTEKRPDKTTTWTSYSYYQNENNSYGTVNKVYWFKYEPIEWKIFDNGDGTKLLLSNSILDAQHFYENGSDRTINGVTVYENNYEYSSIRTWLNDIFYNTAFTELQKDIIITTLVDNSFATTNSDPEKNYCCNDTYDKVFLPSYADVKNSGNFGFTANANRKKNATSYADAQGTRYSSDTNRNAYWVLRSPKNLLTNTYADKTHHTVGYVNYNGSCTADNGAYVFNSYLGVLPMLNLRLPQ